MAELINGKELAEKMQAEIAEKIQKLKDNGIHPGLVVLLVGENPASQIYVRNKERVAKEIGIHSLVERYVILRRFLKTNYLQKSKNTIKILDFMVYWSNYHCQSI